MRTTKSQVTFQAPFTLNDRVGVLEAGTYDVEVDEMEYLAGEHLAYRRTATLLIIRDPGTTRTVAIEASDLEAALSRDAGQAGGQIGSCTDQ